MLSVSLSFFWLFTLALLQFGGALLYQALAGVAWLASLVWPAVFVLVLASALGPSAQAGWTSWFWGESRTLELERSLELAQETARTASEITHAQALQAAAQAQQNSRVAETLGVLAGERADFAGHIRALSDLGLRDSQWAAAVSATGPVLVCVWALGVAGLALWLAHGPVASEQAGLGSAMDVLLDDMAARSVTNTGASKIFIPGSPFLARGQLGVGLQEFSESLARPAPEEQHQEGEPNSEPMPF